MAFIARVSLGPGNGRGPAQEGGSDNRRGGASRRYGEDPSQLSGDVGDATSDKGPKRLSQARPQAHESEGCGGKLGCYVVARGGRTDGIGGAESHPHQYYRYNKPCHYRRREEQQAPRAGDDEGEHEPGTPTQPIGQVAPEDPGPDIQDPQQNPETPACGQTDSLLLEVDAEEGDVQAYAPAGAERQEADKL